MILSKRLCIRIASTTQITDADKKIPDTSGIVKKKKDYNVKTSVIDGKIPSIQIITEKLVKLKNHDKYTTALGFNNLTAKKFAARLAQTNLITRF